MPPQSSQFEVVTSQPTAKPSDAHEQFEVVKSDPVKTASASSQFEVIHSAPHASNEPAPTGASIVQSALPSGGVRLWDLLFGKESKLEDFKHSITNLFINDPVEGAQQVGQGVKGFLTDKTRGQVVKSARNVVEGAGKALTPVAAVTSLLNPVRAVGAIVGATASQKAVDWLGAKAGFSPDLTALAGDIAALVGGTGGFKAAGAVSEAVVGSAAVQSTKGWLNPRAAGPSADAAGSVVAQAKANIANFRDAESIQARQLESAWDRLPPDQQIRAISSYDRTGNFMVRPKGMSPTYSSLYHASMDQAHDVLEQARGDEVGYVENYVKRAYKFKTAADAEKAGPVLVDAIRNSRRSLSGNKSVLRRRSLDMPLDEALQAMRAEGINVEPVTTNPETLRQWTLTNARQIQVYTDAWKRLKKDGLVTSVSSGKPPAGFVALKDPVATTFFPSEKGLVKGQTYYAHPDVARVLDRAISQGLGSLPLYQSLRAVNNLANQINLSVPSFHMLDTGLNSLASDLAAGIQDLRVGRYKQAAQKVARAGTGTSAVGQFVRGNAVVQGLKKGDPIALDVLEKSMNPGGARVALDSRYRTQFLEQMHRAFLEKKLAKGVALSPLAGIQLLSKPLMEGAIPRIKIGAYLDLVDAINEKLPEAQGPQRALAYQKAWESIDNRFGLLTYDNLFWSRMATDVLQLGIRSVGWQYGTLRELGGGSTVDVKKLLTGKGATDRLLFTMMLPVAHAMVGATYQYLHTGKRPESLTDYFYPQNGLLDANGQPQRVSLPSYVNTARNYATHPWRTVGSAESPLLQWAVEAGPWKNENYFGDLIVNPDDPVGTQLMQFGQDALSRGLVPFGVSGAMQLRSQGAPVERQVEGMMGIRNAPADVSKTKTEQLVGDALHHQLGDRHRTPEEVQADQLKAKARQELKQGQYDTLRELIAKGILKNTTKSVKEFEKKAKETSDQRAWQELSNESKLAIYDQLGIPRPQVKRR